MTHRTCNALWMLLGLLIAGTVHAGDCFNDDAIASSDLEPPAPGATADTLRITDDDVQRILREIAAFERRGEPSIDGTTKPR